MSPKDPYVWVHEPLRFLQFVGVQGFWGWRRVSTVFHQIPQKFFASQNVKFEGRRFSLLTETKVNLIHSIFVWFSLHLDLVEWKIT